jgi:hypothetical protein
MTLDGVLRKSYVWKNVRHDQEVWSLLADEWKGAPQAAAR